MGFARAVSSDWSGACVVQKRPLGAGTLEPRLLWGRGTAARFGAQHALNASTLTTTSGLDEVHIYARFAGGRPRWGTSMTVVCEDDAGLRQFVARVRGMLGHP
jgi:hypothetical protein